MALSDARWVLDDGPFGTLSRVLSPGDVRSWPTSMFCLARATADDAVHDKSGRRQGILVAASDNRVVEIFDVETGSSAFQMLFEHLRPGSAASGDLAEHEAIAWVHEVESNAVLVLQDRRAALTALAELGRGRVAHPFEFWEELHGAGVIKTTELNQLIGDTQKQDTGLPGRPWRLRAE